MLRRFLSCAVLIGLEGIVRALTWKDQTLGFIPAMLISAANLILSAWLAERYSQWKIHKDTVTT